MVWVLEILKDDKKQFIKASLLCHEYAETPVHHSVSCRYHLRNELAFVKTPYRCTTFEVRIAHLVSIATGD